MNFKKIRKHISGAFLAVSLGLTQLVAPLTVAAANYTDISGSAITIPGEGWYEVTYTPTYNGVKFYYNPANNKLAISGGTGVGKALTAILTNATYDSGKKLNISAVTNIVVGSDVTMAASVFQNLNALQSVSITSGAAFVSNTSAMFANDPNLKTVIANGATGAALPANISQVFKNTPSLTTLTGLNYTAVTKADQAFYNSGISYLDLRTMINATSTANMLYYTPKLTKINFGANPGGSSGWTGRWVYDADENSSVTAGETVKLASDWVKGTMEYAHPYVKLTTDDQYITAGLGNTAYKTAGLKTDNTYRLDAASQTFTTYCLEWLKDTPVDDYFTVVPTLPSDMTAWSPYLDATGTYTKDGASYTITRDLTAYDNDVTKALQTILFFGYPNDGGALSDTVDKITTEDFYAATQAVIWHVLSGINKSAALTTAGSNTDAANAMYELLLKQTYKNYTDLKGTGNVGITLYTPDDNTAQTMVNGSYSATFSKYDATGTKELAGAYLIVSRDAAAKDIVDEWLSEANKVHRITGLVPNQKYYLTEKSAPAGYEIAEQVSFTAMGLDQHVSMIDKYAGHTITVKKVDDSATPVYVAGAVLTLTGTDYNNKAIVARSVTTTSSGPVTFTNVYPGTYTITEKTTPEGYKTADPVTVNITLTDVADDAKNYTCTMVDKKIRYGSMSLTKVDPKGAALSGAAFKITDSSGNVFTTFTTGSSPTTIQKLVVGETYTLEETAAPNGYNTVDKRNFTVEENATNNIKITDDYTQHSLIIKKVDDAGNRLAGATIKITGTTLAGNSISEITYTSSANEDYKASLLPGTYTITETAAPSGYQVATAQNVTISLTDSEKTITIVNKATSTKPDSKSKDKKDTPAKPSGSSSSASAPKTGDTAPIELLIAIIIISLGAIAGGSFYFWKKSKKQR